MFKFIGSKLFGTRNERLVRTYLKRAKAIDGMSSEMEQSSDEDLKSRYQALRQQVQAVADQGDEAVNRKVNEVLEECFAIVRETAWRKIEMKPYLVQLVGAMILHEGKIAEMGTGEGKTLVAPLSICLNALSGRGVYLITVNDYLAKRDRDWMSPIYDFLGITTGVIYNMMPGEERKKAYQCDVVFGTNSEFGFDYLRDNMCVRLEDQVQGRRHYAIIDEVDSVLIDEARTPLIISGAPEKTENLYRRAQNCIGQLKAGDHFEVEEKHHSAFLTDDGVHACEKILGIDNFYSPQHMEWPHLLENALKANQLYQKDKHYVVQEGEVIIVDEFTGRLQPGRRWSDGLHQAIETKEGLTIREETQTMATVTIQNYIRMFDKLAGMTGTAFTEAQEFFQIYALDVVQVPTNKPVIRDDMPDVIYGSLKDKHEAIMEEVKSHYDNGRPVLVGTVSVERSEEISQLLKRSGIPHEVLNAKNHAREADIIAQAGHSGSVTIATNMAGRGTDIKLGEGVKEKGGLFVLGTERHESRRIDNQLRGRCGRQGDPGATRFYLSLEDDLMRIFANDRVRAWMEKLGLKEGEVIESKMVSRGVERAQKRVEEHNFSMRKNLIEYDDVKNDQRQLIYAERQRILEGDDIKGLVLSLIAKSIGQRIDAKVNPPKKEDVDLPGFIDWMNARFHLGLKADDYQGQDAQSIEDECNRRVAEAYDAKEKEVSPELMTMHQSYITLMKMDQKWKDHLRAMDHLRSGIGMRGYGGSDPKVAYRSEGFELFESMITGLYDDVADLSLKLKVISREEAELRQKNQAAMEAGRGQAEQSDHQQDRLRQEIEKGRDRHQQHQDQARMASHQGAGRAQPVRRTEKKVGRNDPCPCGSGKKYKKCCGA